MSNDTKRSLGVNWDNLFPAVPVELGGKEIEIYPMGLRLSGSVSRRLRLLILEIGAAGIPFEQLKNMDDVKEHLPMLASLLLEKAPDLLSDAANIKLEDIEDMPLVEAIKLLDAIIQANIRSREIFEKNLESLIKTIDENLLQGEEDSEQNGQPEK